MEALAVLAVIFIVAVVFIVMVVKNVIYICGPNELLIFSGSGQRIQQRRIGYRIIQGGRGIRIPMLEVVDKMDLTNMVIDLAVSNAYSKGGIPLCVQGVANIKIAAHEPLVHAAIERFLGKSRAEIIRIAKETLEGNLRGVLATLTPEQVNEDKVAFAESLVHEADSDMSRLGLQLDTLKIQNVSDEVNYLNSLGRVQGALIIRDARIAEAMRQAEAIIKNAENEKETAIAQVNAQMAIAEAEAKRRVIDAQTRGLAMVAEEQSQIVSAVARASADLDVQRARIEQVKRQLQADLLAPASARKEEMANSAKGQAAKIIEDGRATIEVLREMTRTWKEAGVNAKDIFIMKKLDKLIHTLIGTIKEVRIDKMTVIDKELAGGGFSGVPVKAISANEQLKAATGVDLGRALHKLTE